MWSTISVNQVKCYVHVNASFLSPHMWLHTEGGIVGFTPHQLATSESPDIFMKELAPHTPTRTCLVQYSVPPTWPNKVSCMKIHLTWATTVSAGHQFLWSVGLLIESVVSQAKITDRVGFGNGFSLCEDVYTHYVLYLGEQKRFSCEGTCVCVSLAINVPS